jgi:CheY-like chemotaxis protein
MKTILLVEDHESLAYSLVKQLEMAGYTVRSVISSMAALDVLDSDPSIDLVLADIVMPPGQPNGLALGRMARMKRQGIKIAYMTGYDLDNVSLPDAVFRKPLHFEHLVAELRVLLPA